MRPEHTAECFASHLGLWSIESSFLQQALAAIRSGLWKPRADAAPAAPAIPLPTPLEDAPTGERYYVTADGIAILPLHGAMMKARSKFGGVSTIDARRNLRQIAQDEKVLAVLLHIDSPGGHSAGTKELADDVAALAEKKPVHAYLEDLCASAAYWVAAQAKTISTNATSMVGSLGTFAVLYDVSQAAEMEGVKVHVVSTGPLKGAGTPGTPITEEQLAQVRTLVDAIDGHFRAGVKAGRGLEAKALSQVWTGAVWSAEEAKRLGLVDRIESLDAALERVAGPLRAKAAKAKLARA